MKCLRCGQEFELPNPDDKKTNVCGSCADELRAEDDAMVAQAEAEAEFEARARWDAEKVGRIARDSY